ncbi:MAG: ribbon-helix-helix protein, CopG family [Hyphomicrobiales bacterium]|nr:ribbon-helix-helix protein, CopG family [Hyphomicrobiales bacterium]
MTEAVRLRIEPELMDEIRALAAKEERNVSDMIRWLLRRAIASYKDGKPKS